MCVVAKMPRKNPGVCHKCGKVVGQVSRHYSRVHQLKFWGYKCPHCDIIQCRLDSNFMRRHLATHAVKTDLTSCRVVVPSGYKTLLSCPVCPTRTFTEQEMSTHFFNVHPPELGSFEEYLLELEEVLPQDSVTETKSPDPVPDYEDTTPPSSPDLSGLNQSRCNSSEAGSGVLSQEPQGVSVAEVPLVLVTHTYIDGRQLEIPQFQVTEDAVQYVD